MIAAINETHDPQLRSWVESANHEVTGFPIQNLPLGVFRRHDDRGYARVGASIGDQILDLSRCRADGLLDGLLSDCWKRVPHAC